jgi:hypothetical protein
MTIAGDQGETSYGAAPEVLLRIAERFLRSTGMASRRWWPPSPGAPPRPPGGPWSAVVFCSAFDGLPLFSGFSSSWARLDGQVIPLTADFTD